MASTVRSRINKWDLIKLQNFCKAKDTVNRTKQEPTEWEKIYILLRASIQYMQRTQEIRL